MLEMTVKNRLKSKMLLSDRVSKESLRMSPEITLLGNVGICTERKACQVKVISEFYQLLTKSGVFTKTYLRKSKNYLNRSILRAINTPY